MRTTMHVVALLLLCCSIFAQDADQAQLILSRWSFLQEEYLIQSLQQKLSKQERPGKLAFVNVNVITMRDDRILPKRTVLVENGRIQSIVESDKARVPEGYLKIDGEGRYLMPGLVDMHVHNLVSSSQHLLSLATGLTTLRDMDGFDWLLKQREQAKQNALFAPNLYVAGHILNANAMGWYATVVKSPEEAREVVRKHKQAGYDFIKVHNNLPYETYAAILDEARTLKIDVVGHIPHQLKVKQAIELGQVTLEHFKGYLLDSTLTLSTENYVEATKGSAAWNCPTLYNYRGSIRGDEARKLVKESTEMKYVSWRDKKDWLKEADQPPDPVQQNVLPLEQKILRDLIPVTDRFLAGTDSGGGYSFMVPGFALHEELRLLKETGLSTYQTLRSATVNAATAMKQEKEFGTVEAGKRADLILLRENPLEGLERLRTQEGVVVRGRWIPRREIDAILSQVEAIYNPPAEQQVLAQPMPESVRDLLQKMKALSADGFVLRSHDVAAMNKLLELQGIADRL